MDATLRRLMKLKPGVVVEKFYAGFGVCAGQAGSRMENMARGVEGEWAVYASVCEL